MLAAPGGAVARRCCSSKSRGKRKSAEFDDNLGRLAEQGEDRLAQPMDSLSDTGRMRAPYMGATFPTTSSSRNPARIARCRRRRTSRSRPTVRTDETISSETAVNLDQGDPLAEADFHMAYGLYDQAADLVRIAIQREPRSSRSEAQAPRSVLRLGQQGAVPHDGARALRHSRRNPAPGEWEKIVIMGKQIAPEDPMFSDGGGGGSAVGVDLNLDAGGSGRVDFDPFDVSSRMDVTGGGNADPVDLDLGSALRDPDATGEGLQLPDRDGERPDHARDDGQDDAGRLRSADRRATRAASAGRADDSREGRRRHAPQAVLGSDRRARARRSRPGAGLARADGFADRPQARGRHAARSRRRRARPWSRASTRIHSACWRAAAARQGGMAMPTIRSSPSTARAAPGS